jgi:hypothetical protein
MTQVRQFSCPLSRSESNLYFENSTGLSHEAVAKFKRNNVITVQYCCSTVRHTNAATAQSWSRSYFTTEGQSVSMSWYRVPLWDLRLPVGMFEVEIKVEVYRQSVSLGIEHPCGTCDQILFPVGMLLSEIWVNVSVRRPLWREDRSAICSVITQWSE